MKRRLGDRGERLAARWLAARGHEIIERNFRTRFGEIDLVTRHKDTLVFVEVKTRRGTGFGDPLEAITEKKQEQVRSMAEQYLAGKGDGFVGGFEAVRFDAVGIVLGGDGPSVHHVEDAF